MTGSKNQTNPLKRRDRLVWFFIHFRGPKALDDTFVSRRSLPLRSAPPVNPGCAAPRGS